MDESDRRTSNRVRLEDTLCRVQVRASPWLTGLANLSPGGMGIEVSRIDTPETHEILDAWLNGLPVRVSLVGSELSSAALIVWARGPRREDDPLQFGLRFVKPMRNFAAAVRALVT